MVEKHFNNKIAPVRSRGGSLVRDIDTLAILSLVNNNSSVEVTASIKFEEPSALRMRSRWATLRIIIYRNFIKTGT
jgi:hypothetical protein